MSNIKARWDFNMPMFRMSFLTCYIWTGQGLHAKGRLLRMS